MGSGPRSPARRAPSTGFGSPWKRRRGIAEGPRPPPMPPLPHRPARSWLVGRSPDCDLVAAGDGVSARHCRLTATARGLVEDLGSTNGTFVNGRRVAGL